MIWRFNNPKNANQNSAAVVGQLTQGGECQPRQFALATNIWDFEMLVIVIHRPLIQQKQLSRWGTFRGRAPVYTKAPGQATPFPELLSWLFRRRAKNECFLKAKRPTHIFQGTLLQTNLAFCDTFFGGEVGSSRSGSPLLPEHLPQADVVTARFRIAISASVANHSVQKLTSGDVIWRAQWDNESQSPHPLSCRVSLLPSLVPVAAPLAVRGAA